MRRSSEYSDDTFSRSHVQTAKNVPLLLLSHAGYIAR